MLELIAQGLDNAQIAARLELSEKTVRNNITHIFDKIEVENRSQAIVLAREAGLGAARPSAERDRGPACFPLPAPVSGLRPHACAAGSPTIASPTVRRKRCKPWNRSASARYAKCIEVSKRIRWDIDRDVIRGRKFDVSKKFLPDGLSMAWSLDFLSEGERAW